MLKNQNQNQNQILIFITKITSKNLQDIMIFLQKYNFKMKRITKKSIPKNSFLYFKNSNYILECHLKISFSQLQDIVSFLNQYSLINSILFENQILNPFSRALILSNSSKINLWKQINNFKL